MVRVLSGKAGGILSYFVRHRTVANLLLILLLAAGAVSIPNMRAQFFPDVIVDDVDVSVVWDGAGADDVDRGIVQVLEPAVLSVEGVESSEATSREGRASIRLEFEPGWDMSRAADDVQTAIDAVSTLPADAEDPVVRRGTWRDRVTDLVITGPVGVDQLARFADELSARLFAEGVTRTTIRGLSAPRTVIEVPSANLIAFDISMRQIAEAISQEVDADPAGDVGNANTRVRTGVEKRSAEQIADIVLRSNPDGSNLTVGDVGTIIIEGIDRERSYFVGENPAISIRVDRSDQGDAIAIQRKVEEVATEFEASLPAGVSVDLIRTRAEAITGRLDILLDNGLTGLGLVVLLLFLFLNARTAFWVAAGIPAAMMAAIALMYAGGITINMISLFALIITLGIVVDDAIVVGEHADHLARSGLPPVEAAERAAQRMALPVFAATLTTIIAFFGLVAIGGRFGDLIADIPFTVIAVLAASLVECFLILPNHMAHAIAHSAKEHWYDIPSRVVNRGFRWMRETMFRPFMALIIQARYAVLAGAVVLLASQAALFIRGDVQWRFFNSPEQSSVTGNFAMAPGATREDTFEMMRIFQRSVEDVAKSFEDRHGVNPIDYVIAEVGGNAGRGIAGADTKDADQLGGISIELIDADLRPFSSRAFVTELQDSVPRHPMVETISFRSWGSGPQSDALDVQFYGASADTLKAASEDLKTALLQYPEVSAVEDTLAYDKEELILELTPQGQALGFTIDGLGSVLRARLGGVEAATYPDGPRSAEIRVELPIGELTADFLERTQMRTPEGAYVQLADIVSVERRTGFSTVRRENGIRLISVTGDISEDDPARANDIMLALETEILPTIASERQVDYRLSGLSEQEGDFLNDARTGLILSLLAIYLVLSWVFASWTRPLVVMSVIPFGLVGTIYGHAAWDVPLSMFTVVGLLGMTGIIINDSIVLVTTIDEKAQDRGLIPSIIDGAADRLRPVFLTTATTVLGLVPLLYEQSSQAQFLKPTVITLVYGLGFGMFLVLLIVPSLIAIQNDIGRLTQTARRGLRFRQGGIRVLLGTASALIVAWLGATMGAFALTGALPEILRSALADTPLGGDLTLARSLGFFLVGAAVICLTVYLLSAVALVVSRMRSRSA
ncbi:MULTISPECIES: efflux RND transporter permease subunit [Marivita]|uniref:Efflux RND transporter permease subunit n=1 Tax=Marivita cryptomonadis TaxID=505252 RepID=A0A9Q2S504_9RHOB|nr:MULTISPECIES: efflux RND transporter permease subunit [Marivita]MCR9169422.1 efflux RND transporter permease subunit [Paracoccaceae bacterium]MBM2321708.1 efflux RND transporter permease subunit [Marivita cryptomonadis]MBM2331289.1 efflux RND transporter permease subunit [Marivita cryptomonadis]MBM2340875.1 efflux RND transporter permease subunit [Marivita cryptomonadis]MBM2345537.1 efflux RND transporter permease subunit [Marivita cryptomonadis]